MIAFLSVQQLGATETPVSTPRIDAALDLGRAVGRQPILTRLTSLWQRAPGWPLT